MLGAIWRPKPGNPETYDVRLRPNGSAAGRLADKEGQPLARPRLSKCTSARLATPLGARGSR